MKRAVILAALSLLTLACSEGTPVDVNTDRQEPENEGFAIRVVDSTAASSGGENTTVLHRTSAGLEEELQLEVRLKSRDYTIGEPIFAKLFLRNISERPVLLFDPQRSIPADLECLLVPPNGRERSARIRREFDENSIRAEDLYAIEPGETVSADVDLGPLVAETAGEKPGNYKAQLTFRGGYQGRRLSMRVWNRSRVKQARSMRFNLTLRARPVPPGVNVKLEKRLDELLTTPEGGKGIPAESAKALTEMGGKIYPSLIGRLALASSRKPEERAIAWNTYDFLLEAGAPALKAATALPVTKAKAPLQAMLAKRLECLLAEEAKDPVAAKLSEEFNDPQLRRSHVFRITVTSEAGKDTEIIRVVGDGLVHYERHNGREPTSRSGMLAKQEVEALLSTLLEEQFWLQTSARKAGGPKENHIIIEHLKLTRSAEGTESRPDYRIEVWEKEATERNRSLARIVEALRGTKLALER